MSDLIDRQSAIEAIEPILKSILQGNSFKAINVMDEIRKLPSVEPRWISCSERLPEDEQRVLCQTVTKKGAVNIVIGYHAEGRWCCGMNSNVIAWQELPEPYKEARG